MEQQLSSLLRKESNKVSLFLTIMLFRYFQAHLILVIFYIFSSSPLILALTDLGNNATDRRALLSFKSLLTSAEDVLVSWNDSSGICNWYGVGCEDPRHADRVTSLKLGTLSLSGTISPSLANLTFLRYLNLSSNKLHGVIPEDLGRLRWLKHLELGDNLLEGEIPETLSHCTDLLTFALAGNNLSGSIPANLSRLSNLQDLLLQGNRLTGDIPPELGLLPMLLDLSLRDNNLTGSIPPSLGNISTLTYLHLSFNNLKGTIPPELSKIKRMLIFDVGFNGLSGTIPPVMFNFSSLYTFAVERNLLTGRLPSDLGQSLPSLEILFLYNNHFEGPIPLSLANCTNFQNFELDNNSFSGIVPPIFGRMQNLYKILLGSNNFVATGEEDWSFMESLTNCSSLEHIDLSENNFSGFLPHSIINLPPPLGWLRLRDNQIMGEIPLGIGNLSGLVTLNFDNNHLTGSIPSTIGKLRNLTAFTLRSNNLAGVIPDSICNLIQMLELHMSGNGFSGSIPSCFPSMQKLIVLDLSHNNLSGIIPKGLLAISSIVSFLNMSNNFLTGVLPEEVGSLANLQILDVSNNKFFGTIPRSLGKCVLLEYLYLEGNDFNGSIPEDLKNLRGIQLLDMSRNHFSGSIPTFLEDMTALQYLNLSFNDLEGEVPTEGLFSNLSRFSIEGNNKLCGGDYRLRMKSCSRYGDGGNRKISKPVLTVIISIAALVSLSMCCFLFYKFSPKKYDRKPTFYREYSWMDNQFLKISYTDIQKATNNFSPGNLIGSGGFGNVYKGVITMGKKIEIAVKVLNEQLRATSKSFIAECTVLRNVRHRNLVRLLTACSSIDPQGNEFMALVYELMPNGSLEKWLHEYESSCALNFLQRLNVAIDVASALDYLHSQTEITIVHRDLKPSNVLLDSDMVAHVSDFGISKLISSDLDQTITTAVQGSIGYTAPECGMGSRLSALWDVYSYGILLLEMFTGKSPTDEAFGDGMTLHKYVEVRFPNEIMSIVDPRLLEQEKYDRTSKNSIYDAMVSIVRIGLICSNDAPNERMQMDGVIRRLDDIKDTLLREDTVMQLKGSYESQSLLEKWK